MFDPPAPERARESVLRSVKGEFIAVGDFNEDFEIMASTNLEQEVRGRWVHVNESTCAGGGNLDYGVLSPSLASGASLTLDWITPFAPHAALRWKINLKHLDMCVPQLASFKPSPLCPQPFVENAQQGRANALYAPGQEPSILGVPVARQSLAGRFAELSEAVELATYGVTQGRGVQPKLTRAKLLHPVAPAACWGGAKASFWRRMVVWLESCLKRFHVSPFAAYAKSRLRGVWWGDPVELEVFSSKLVSLMELGDFSVTQNLLSVAAEQFHNHTKSWMKGKSATYRSWLTQASHKGLRGLFRSVKAEEAVHIRPFLEVPLQERIYLRWRQWFDLWTGPQGVDADLFADLKAKAMAQAKSLGPIPLDKAVSLFKKVPTKAPGLDGWTCEILQNLQQPAVQAILDFLHHCECEASWPDQMVFALIALLPKSEKRERPIQCDCDRWGAQTSGARAEVIARLERLCAGEAVAKKGCARKFVQLKPSRITTTAASSTRTSPAAGSACSSSTAGPSRSTMSAGIPREQPAPSSKKAAQAAAAAAAPGPSPDIMASRVGSTFRARPATGAPRRSAG